MQIFEVWNDFSLKLLETLVHKLIQSWGDCVRKDFGQKLIDQMN
jgi:hypothetical protein